MRSWMWLGSRAYRTSALGISRLPSNNSLREPASFLSSLASLPRVDAASALSEADTKRFAEDGAIVLRQVCAPEWVELMRAAAEVNRLAHVVQSLGSIDRVGDFETTPRAIADE